MRNTWSDPATWHAVSPAPELFICQCEGVIIVSCVARQIPHVLPVLPKLSFFILLYQPVLLIKAIPGSHVVLHLGPATHPFNAIEQAAVFEKSRARMWWTAQKTLAFDTNWPLTLRNTILLFLHEDLLPIEHIEHNCRVSD